VPYKFLGETKGLQLSLPRSCRIDGILHYPVPFSCIPVCQPYSCRCCLVYPTANRRLPCLSTPHSPSPISPDYPLLATWCQNNFNDTRHTVVTGSVRRAELHTYIHTYIRSSGWRYLDRFLMAFPALLFPLRLLSEIEFWFQTQFT